MKRSAALILVLAAVQCSPTSDSILAIAGGGGGTGGGTSTVRTPVNIFDNIFSPSSVTITRNTSVRWTWGGDNQHSVVFDDGGQSENAKLNGTFDRRFTESRVYTYYCSVHGRDVMSGVVTVNDPITP